MLTDESQTAESSPERPPDDDAVFKGWQKTGSGEVFALYNVTASEHPSHGSTVSEKTLHKMNLRAPDPPDKPGTSED